MFCCDVLLKMLNSRFEFLSLPGEIEDNLVKGQSGCHCQMSQQQIREHFYRETGISTISSSQSHSMKLDNRLDVTPKLLNAMVLMPAKRLWTRKESKWDFTLLLYV